MYAIATLIQRRSRQVMGICTSKPSLKLKRADAYLLSVRSSNAVGRRDFSKNVQFCPCSSSPGTRFPLLLTSVGAWSIMGVKVVDGNEGRCVWF